MKAEIISIGDELLIGQVINTNASWMAEQLSLAKIEVIRITTISDSREDILQSLDDAFTRADVILITGGLGPTRDDITKNTLCEYFDSKLLFHEPSFRNVEKLFRERGMPILEVNRKQAEIPHNCTPITNENGTAPGMWFEKEGRIYVSMPGVPFEMKAMLSDHVLPKLRKRLNGLHMLYKKILTQGVGESFLSEMIQDWEEKLPDHMKLAYLPQPGIVRLRLTGTGSDQEMLSKELDEKVKELGALIPELIFGYGEDTLEEVVGKLLKKQAKTLATAESCTGGYIAHLITSIPGSSAYFTGSVIAYSNQIKAEVLDVKEDTLMAHGAVSEQTVTEMARAVKIKFGTDYAIAVSGIAGPDGGTEQKPVGTTWIAVAGPSATIAEKFLFGKNRKRNIRLAAVTALNKLRMMIVKNDQQ
ncbi:MAG: competence/damage-inducible protein A [Bacteroidetes bacterium]|nr:competence/damage-inducible protein A [Bacteroidota bacterium]